MIAGRIARRLLDAPRTRPEEATLGSALDALGGEIVRLRANDGLRLAARWLPATGTDADPREAILLLHGWSGSITPDLVEYGPWLRTHAGVLGLDFRGHGASDASPTTFGLREVDDVAAALAWLGERGVDRVVLMGTSMGGLTAIAAAAVLGDGRSQSEAPAGPRIAGVVADSVGPDLPTIVANRLPGPGPLRPWLARRAFADMARRLGGDPRATEPIRVVGLLEDLPLLLVHGEADRTVPIAAGRRLAREAGTGAEHWVVPRAEHSLAHATAPEAYRARVGAFVRAALRIARPVGRPPDILAPMPGTADAPVARDPEEDLPPR